MDGGPFRATRPTGSRASGAPEPAQRQVAVDPQPTYDEPKAAHRSVSPRNHAAQEDRSSKKLIVWIVVAFLVVVLAAAGWFVWSSSRSNTLVAIDSSKYQAVFFTNGQVYFGKLQAANDGYIKMTDIYYLQSQQTSQSEADSNNPQQASTAQNNVQLIKLGEEVHGPEDEMVISRDQVLFYENLKADGKVAQSIEKHKSSN